ncbi:MAG: hypothetical protein M1816_003335 [Peltula sp. TS41687]|nr:MAG: hypothetical protein M1816_003335 [Peltula sp. TS41687]
MTSNSQSTPPVRSSLGAVYASLLDPSSNPTTASPASISRAPVVFKPDQGGGEQPQDDTSSRKQQVNSASLRFQPTKRPQLPTQKPKPKASFPKFNPLSTNTNASNQAPSSATSSSSVPAPVRRPPVKSTLADWTGGDDDVNGFYGGEKRQRGGRKKRKKNKEDTAVPQVWDDLYDPSRPNSYEEYKHSDEKIREVREWKDRLYAHRMARRRSSDMESGDERPQMTGQFAPPPSYSFAPPPSFENDGPSIPPPPAPVDMPDDPTGEDAYMRRMRLSRAQQEQPISQQLPSTEWQSHPSSESYMPPPPPNFTPQQEQQQQQLPPLPPPPPPSMDPTATISRAPVRYNLPAPPPEIPASEAELEAAIQEGSSQPEQASVEDQDQDQDQDQPRSLRPGQKGFAERLMSKYGWTKGTGLGASGTGIVNPLRVKVEKQKRKADSEGGGVVGPSGGARGKIIGGKKRKGGDAEDEEGLFGRMSEVVVLKGMVDGMDLEAEMSTGDLMQEIGEECGEKYGRVERVFIHQTDSPDAEAEVYVKFTSQLSALRAVNALQDRIFNGNRISARFFDTDKFEAGMF